MEAIDRLFRVADRKEGTVPPVDALPGEEFCDQPGNDFPLGRAGVLCFVDKDMIKAAIKPEEYPACDSTVRQKGG